MQRGEIWWVDFGQTVGGEIQKRRPAVIVSNDSANQHANRVQVVPVTSNIGKLYPCDAVVSIDGRPCRAMADQLMTVSKHRLAGRVGSVAPIELRALEAAIRIQLAIVV